VAPAALFRSVHKQSDTSSTDTSSTQKRDVTQRLKNILSREGVRVEVLTTAVPPEAREAWYERQVKAGMQVCVAHPRLVATGLDYVEY
jgi:hypothetical protein